MEKTRDSAIAHGLTRARSFTVYAGVELNRGYTALLPPPL